MALRQILEFPDSRLRIKAKPVTDFDDRLGNLVADLFETMYEAKGIGLAATQVNVHQRLLVVDVTEEKDQPLVFINPQAEIIEPELSEYDEGCLSVPGFYETVSRPSSIRVKAQDPAGNDFTMVAEGLLSTCIQHEIDHLDGKLFVDYISNLKRQRIRDKLEKARKKPD